MMQFLGGVLAALCLTAALIFLRFWKKSGDRFFGFFALAFVVMGLNRISLAFIPEDQEPGTLAYLVRLAAFVLILLGIVDKNRSRSR